MNHMPMRTDRCQEIDLESPELELQGNVSQPMSTKAVLPSQEKTLGLIKTYLQSTKERSKH